MSSTTTRKGSGPATPRAISRIPLWVSQDLEIRPELFYDRSYDESAYDKGNHDYQFVALIDAILHY